jgi:myosin heavy subunit
MSQAFPNIPAIEIPGKSSEAIAEESLIKNKYYALENLSNEKKDLQATVDMNLESNEEYVDLDEQIQTLQKKKVAVKNSVLADDSMKETVTRLKEVSEEIKDVKDSLNNHVKAYETMTQLSWIDMGDKQLTFKRSYRISAKRK